MQGLKEKKILVADDSILNADDATYALSPNNWVNMENMRIETTDAGVAKAGQFIGGTKLLSTPQPSINYLAIGSAADDENGMFAEFKFNTTGRQDKIVAYYKSTGVEYDVLLSSQVIGGLNFSKNSPIHSARIANGRLYWVDGRNNQPRKINLAAAIKANNPSFVTDEVPYNFPIDFREITIIKPPPPLAPNITKNYDPTFSNNFIANESFEFVFQYVWYDNETTVTGCYSVNSRLNFPAELFNRIIVQMSTFENVPDTVRIVNLIMRFSNTNNAVIVKTWDKDIASQATEIANQNTGAQLLTFNFYNSNTGPALATDEVLRPFDNVPFYSEGLEVFKNRLGLANNTDGMDTPVSTSFLLRRGSTIILEDTTQSVELVAIRHRYNRLPNITKFYAYSGWYVYLSFASVPGYYLINGTDASVTYPAPPVYPTLPAAPTTAAYTSGITFKGATLSDVINNTRPTGFTITSEQQLIPQGSFVTITGITPQPYNVMTQESQYFGGVVFYDFAMRKCGVSNNNPNNAYTLYQTIPSISIASVAPHTIVIISTSGAYINKGDRIEIIGTGAAGTYTVDGIVLAGISPVTYSVTVVEAVPSVAPSSGTVNVYALNSISVVTPARSFTYNTAITGLDWSLSNADALTEIPEDAYYYCPVLTLNQRTRFFIQSFTNAAKYVTKDTNGDYQYTSTTYLPNVVGIGLNTDALNLAGLGYIFTEGDQCILIKSTNDIFKLPVIAQDGNYIIIKAQDIGSLNSVQFVFEVYTPYKTQEQEPYFEQGGMQPISNPGTLLREYSLLNGSFRADSYAFTRNYAAFTYFAGAMSPNDLFYKRWDNDGGKVNYVTKLGRAYKTQYISWSDTFIPNTAINGLSTFRAANQIGVPEDCGGIYKLILTSKAQSEGTVMLSICANETCSLYLQETQITDSTGATQFFSATDKVISTINVLKGSRGTTHAESVVQYRGNVFWWDNLNNRIVQYSVNGLFDISDYKMTRFWNLFSQKFASMTASEIETFGGRPFVFAAVDPFHEELLFSIPKLSNTPPKGFLPDYPDKIYPFDILDFQGKTVVYKLGMSGKPKWLGAFSFNPEGFVMMQSELYANKNGHLYLHNQPLNMNEFYGVQYSSKIMMVSNAMLNNPKVYNNVASESNIVPSFVYFYNDTPVQQASDLVDNDFTDNGAKPMGLEGVWYSTIKRNKLVPTADGYTSDGLLTGQKMRNTAMYIMWEWRVGNTPLQLKFLNIGYTPGLGQPVSNG